MVYLNGIHILVGGVSLALLRPYLASYLNRTGYKALRHGSTGAAPNERPIAATLPLSDGTHPSSRFLNRSTMARPVFQTFWLCLSVVFLLDSVTKWLVSTYVRSFLRIAQSPLIILPGFANRGIPASARAEHYLLLGGIAVILAIVWAWGRWPNRWTWTTVGALILFL